MTARVLIVDDIPTNVRLLEARLTAEYFEVRTASSGRDALAICAEGATDIVLDSHKQQVQDNRAFIDEVRRRHRALKASGG